ncbi:MAG: sigma-70 family RNA polymerase sigma factor [Verrucomicrobia bacterium]|nr:sigma-70 family RNA polymerase sigma factor [Verrucomicrobiota bacterium]
MSEPPLDANKTSITLLQRIKNLEDHDGWQRFYDAYWKLIYSVATRAGLTPSEAQEVVQESMLTVVKHAKDFKYDPQRTFRGWLLTITRWRIADQFRKRIPVRPSRPKPSGSRSRTSTMGRIADPAGTDLNAIWEAEWKNHILETSLQRVKQKVDSAQYRVFDLYVNQNKTVEEVAQALGVTTGYVYLIKHRVTALLKEEVKRLENPHV